MSRKAPNPPPPIGVKKPPPPPAPPKKTFCGSCKNNPLGGLLIRSGIRIYW